MTLINLNPSDESCICWTQHHVIDQVEYLNLEITCNQPLFIEACATVETKNSLHCSLLWRMSHFHNFCCDYLRIMCWNGFYVKQYFTPLSHYYWNNLMLNLSNGCLIAITVITTSKRQSFWGHLIFVNVVYTLHKAKIYSKIFSPLQIITISKVINLITRLVYILQVRKIFVLCKQKLFTCATCHFCIIPQRFEPLEKQNYNFILM